MHDWRVNIGDLEEFVCNILVAEGVDSHEAQIITSVLVWNELVGRATQGLLRLPIYLKRLQNGLIKSPSNPEFDQKSDAICIVKGNEGFGQFLGHCAMSKAVELAEANGVGVVGVSGSNHFGSGAYFLQLAAGANQLSLVTSNSFPKVAPHGGLKPVLGTNPIAFGAPIQNGKSILIDFSTGALAGSTIRKAIVEQEKLPEGTIIDESENFIEDPKLASHGVMLPFGGTKGYCLSILAEILSGIITGAAISHEIGSIYHDFEKPNSVGHFFLTINISRILPLDIYFERMQTLISFIKNSKRRKGFDEILLPGETRWRHYEKQMTHGIDLDRNTFESLSILAKEMNVATPW